MFWSYAVTFRLQQINLTNSGAATLNKEVLFVNTYNFVGGALGHASQRRDFWLVLCIYSWGNLLQIKLIVGPVSHSLLTFLLLHPVTFKFLPVSHLLRPLQIDLNRPFILGQETFSFSCSLNHYSSYTTTAPHSRWLVVFFHGIWNRRRMDGFSSTWLG